MARPTKTQQRTTAEIRVRADKAKAAIVEHFAKLLAKHIIGILGSGNGSTFTVDGAVTPDGVASLGIRYTATVTDGAGFKLDDGQTDLPLTPAPGESKTAAPAEMPATPGGDGE